MAKKVIPAGMVNELKGSSLFSRPQTAKTRPQPASQRTSKRRLPPKRVSIPTKRSISPPAVRPNDRTDDYGRVKTRYAFEFFQDQIVRIKELRRSALINDRPFTMSDWVRKAIDKALKEVDRTGERPNER